MVRPGGRHDVRFLRDMLRHAYYWRERMPHGPIDAPVQRYVLNWGRPGDAAVIAIDDGNPVGAAWYRLFKESERGYGFVDEQTPELSIAIVPSKRGTGLGSELLDALLDRARTDGYEAITLSVEKDSPAVGLYERHGLQRLGEDDGGVTMKASLV
jgi:ribosomal protein S18 acetylase RimI-like enzyme